MFNQQILKFVTLSHILPLSSPTKKWPVSYIFFVPVIILFHLVHFLKLEPSADPLIQRIHCRSPSCKSTNHHDPCTNYMHSAEQQLALTPYLLSNIVLSPSFSSSWWQRTARWWSRSPWPCHSSHTFWFTVFISTGLTHSFSCSCVTPNSSRSLVKSTKRDRKSCNSQKIWPHR